MHEKGRRPTKRTGHFEKRVAMEDKERLTVVLKHLIEHNEGHAEDYRRWVDLARTSGMDKVAGLIEEAERRAEEASASLKKALALMEG